MKAVIGFCPRESQGEYRGEVLAVSPDSGYFMEMDVSPHGVLAFDPFTEDYHRLYIMK